MTSSKESAFETDKLVKKQQKKATNTPGSRSENGNFYIFQISLAAQQPMYPLHTSASTSSWESLWKVAQITRADRYLGFSNIL